MPKEILGLHIGEHPEDSTDVSYWYPRHHHDYTHRPNTTFIIGLLPINQNLYYPIELDLKQKAPKNIFLVGFTQGFKEKFLLGLLDHTSFAISKDYLEINLITDSGDPNQLINSPYLAKHHSKNLAPTKSPRSPTAARILEETLANMNKKDSFSLFSKPDPSILILENMRNFVEKSGYSPKNIENLKNILAYKGKKPHLTVGTIDVQDLPVLAQAGIGPDITPGIWLFEKQGSFHIYRNSKHGIDQTPILPLVSPLSENIVSKSYTNVPIPQQQDIDDTGQTQSQDLDLDH